MNESDWALNECRMEAQKLITQIDLLLFDEYSAEAFNIRVNGALDICDNIKVRLVCLLRNTEVVKQAQLAEDD
jgi:hypothetical protein